LLENISYKYGANKEISCVETGFSGYYWNLVDRNLIL